MVQVSRGRVRTQLVRTHNAIRDASIAIRGEDCTVSSQLDELELAYARCLLAFTEEPFNIEKAISEVRSMKILVGGMSEQLSSEREQSVLVDGVPKRSEREIMEYLFTAIADLERDLEQHRSSE